MKKRTLLYSLPMLAILLAACGDTEDSTSKEDTTKTEQQDQTTEKTEDTAEDSTSDDSASTVLDTEKEKPEIPFNDFSIDIDYPTGEYSLEYEKEFSGEKADLEDDRNNNKVVGEEALTNFKPLLKKFTFDATTADEQVEKQLFSIIQIDDDYIKIELDVEFSDGVKKEYHFTNTAK